MSKYTVAGLVSWLFSGLLVGFQAIAVFMKMEDQMVWKSLTLVDFLDEGHLTWIDGISRGEPFTRHSFYCHHAVISVAVFHWGSIFHHEPSDHP